MPEAKKANTKTEPQTKVQVQAKAEAQAKTPAQAKAQAPAQGKPKAAEAAAPKAAPSALPPARFSAKVKAFTQEFGRAEISPAEAEERRARALGCREAAEAPRRGRVFLITLRALKKLGAGFHLVDGRDR